MRRTRRNGEPKLTLVWPAHARDGTEARYSHGLIRRRITVTDREGVVTRDALSDRAFSTEYVTRMELALSAQELDERHRSHLRGHPRPE